MISHLKEKFKDSAVFRLIDRYMCHKFKKKLHNSNFTILSSNCVGGCIYHRLGMQFLSPTVNLMFSSPDFVSFCIHLDDYLNCDLHFIRSKEKYPVALLGEGTELPVIKIDFVHYKNEEDARDKWNSRKQRINRNNLYIILYDAGLTENHIEQLKHIQCNNIVIFTENPRQEIPWFHVIKPTKKHGYNFLFRDLFGVRYYEKKWDFVGFLNRKSQ